jgi:hypothetical protein
MTHLLCKTAGLWLELTMLSFEEVTHAHPRSAADFGKFIADETEKWASVVRVSGAKYRQALRPCGVNQGEYNESAQHSQLFRNHDIGTRSLLQHRTRPAREGHCGDLDDNLGGGVWAHSKRPSDVRCQRPLFPNVDAA